MSRRLVRQDAAFPCILCPRWQPDVFLARSTSNTWFGPWERIGKIVDHNDLPHHNPREHPDYEWGSEGAQLIELPDGRVLLNATYFLPSGARGIGQRVFFAIADKIEGPGPVLDPSEPGVEWSFDGDDQR